MSTELIQAISTVGFPIVACAALFWQSHENSKNHKEETSKWSEVLNNNTLAIQRLSDMIESLLRKEVDS